SDTKIIRLDENKGTDYLLILYSKEPLDSPQLLRQLNESTEKGLSSKIIKALGDKLILKENIQYDPQKVGFRTVEKTGTRNLTVEEDAPANSKNSSGTVVPLMVEIKHN
ncbi:MAG TPA: hypothetical protein PKJ24_09840, partial [Prolixibacteraceae bacterium]|nr:hypothetical protein [Prolixibacteraceae bacterium]